MGFADGAFQQPGDAGTRHKAIHEADKVSVVVHKSVDVSRCSKSVFFSLLVHLCVLLDSISLPKYAKVQVELRCHFDETNAFGGVLLADSVVSVSSLTHFSADIEMDMKDISAALNVVNAEYGKSQGSVADIERAYLQQAHSQSSAASGGGQSTMNTGDSANLKTGEVGAKSGAKCAVTLRLKYDPANGTVVGGASSSQTPDGLSSANPGSSQIDAHAHETSRIHKISVGKLFVTLWQGKSLNTSCPVFVTMFLATLRSKGCRSPSRPNPHNPVFDYMCEVDVYSLQADLVVEVRIA
jgi:hypothetical protein